jgi:hypothetical protein
MINIIAEAIIETVQQMCWFYLYLFLFLVLMGVIK